MYAMLYLSSKAETAASEDALCSMRHRTGEQIPEKLKAEGDYNTNLHFKAWHLLVEHFQELL